MSRALRLERGIAAIEFAVILPVLVTLLACTLFFGRVFWHYTVAQKAAHDVARYMSTVDVLELKTPARTAEIVKVAQAIAAEELADLNPGPYAPSVAVQCDGIPCDGFSTPQYMRSVVRMPMYDSLFGSITSDFFGDQGLLLTADVSMRYQGQ